MSLMQKENQLEHSVSLNKLQTYLTANGWQATPNRNPRIQVYQGSQDDAGNPIQVVLTENESYIDTPRRISEVITTLAELEERLPAQVAQAVATVNDDVFLWKLNPESHDQTISVEQAGYFIGGLQHLLTYSACLEETPQPYFPKATAIGREFVQHCRFGHTQPGSFIFEMEAPLTFDNSRQASYINTPPFSRRVMQRLVHGLTEVDQATRSEDAAALAQSYREGFNANAYETLAQMLENVGDSGLEFDCKWSPVLRTSSKKPGFVRLDKQAIPYLAAAAKTLRQLKPLSGVRLRGRILRLGVDTDGTPRMITLDTTVQGHVRHVRTTLDAADYALACDAHRDNQPIQVTGTLEKTGRTWRLLNASDFALA